MLDRLVEIIQSVDTQREIAILCRTNYNVDLVDDKLTRAGIEHLKCESIANQGHSRRFRFELACLRLLANPLNDPACKVIYRTYYPNDILTFKKCQLEATQKAVGVAKVLAGTLPLFQAFCAESEQMRYAYDAIYTFLKRLPINSAFGEWLTDEKSTLEKMVDAEPHKMLTEFLADLSMASIQDIMINRQSEERIKIMTVHAAKGLEFDTVIIFNATEGAFPILRRDTDPEEERRIFYVAMTRAINALWILTETGKESRYLAEIEQC
ncbi:MAG: 3'-5' exonuclease [Candidatus Marinimicrobia bacterium]|jgi:ATP-dependent exoDNAse (exonuclease V) beta subunit|nr:3'-5' exonuclease [Candidatus Neomarinimicrobiota bacterium]MDD5540439.1 3'-5' exonuclease [Candidatus Neomarinimicrobiota bacterium]